MAKSTGQWIGTVVGAVIGAFIPGGYVMLGATLGGMVGGLIDPPKGPKIEGPRINDLNVQTATYGAQIPIIKGTVATFGNIFWVENNQIKETKKTESQGGKGGGGQETTTYSYSATFALGVCLGPVDGIRRIWCSGKLIFDSGANNLSGIMASALLGGVVNPVSFTKGARPEAAGGGGITFYNGGPDQQPDPRMQAALGVANTPAYRGLAYLVFEDFQLADFGNTLMGAQFKIEVVETASTEQYSIRTRVQNGLFTSLGDEYVDTGLTTIGPYNPVIENGVMRFDKERTRYSVSLEGVLLARSVAPGIAPGSVGDPGERFYVGTTSGGHAVYYNTTGPGTSGWLVVGGNTQFRGKFDPDYMLQGACVGADGNLYLHTYNGSGSEIEKYDGIDLSLEWSQSAPFAWNTTTIAYPYLPGTTVSMAVNEGTLLWFLSTAGGVFYFAVYSIGADGTLVGLHTFTSEGGSGWNGHTVCASATGMLCAITHDQGGFYVFDATPIIVDEMVPLSEIVESLCLQSNLLISSDLNVTALTQDVRGYRISATAAIRSTLEPLQACWPFDAIQDGYKIKFIPRGGSSVATVSSDDLGAAAPGDKEVVRLSVSREMDTQLPRRIESTFIDYNREYDTGAGPGAERLNTDAVNIRQIELPVVLTVDEAAGIEQTLLYLAWTERQDILFTLPPTFCAIQPGDVITVNSTDSSYLVRLSRIQYLPDGRLECSAKYNHAPIYTPAAVGQEGVVTGQTLSYGGPTTLALLDVPRMNSVQDQPGLLAGTSGVYSGWPGATLLRSDDTGQSWQSIQGFGTPGSLMGYCTSTIGAGSTHVIDTANRLNVRLFSGALASVTALQMFAGANHFAYGAHGRWEIIAGMTVTAEADGTYTLQNLMRGRFGTERYMTTHGATDMLVALDESRLRFIGMNWGSLNLVNQWRAVTRGYMLDSAADVNLAYTGVNFECLSPVVIKGGKNSTGDWTIEWTRRTRTPVEPFSGLNAPLAESSEAYEVEIYSDNTYTTLKRTLTGLTSASATYTSAQQTTDFGVVQKYLYLKVYQLSATVGRGYSATEVVGPTHLLNLKSLIHFDEGGSEYIPYRVLGLHCNGTNGSTTFTDVHGKTVTANGNAQISTAQYPALTGKTSSGYFDGSGDYLSTPDSADWDFGTGDFTIRIRARFSSHTTNQTIVSNYQNSTTGWTIQRRNDTNSLRLYLAGDTPAIDVSWTPSDGVWYVIEFLRIGTSLQARVDGAQVGSSVTDSTNISGSTNPLIVGSLYSGGSYIESFNGYLSELEIVKGAVISASDYTPSTAPFVDSSPEIIDKAGNTVTVTGTATVVANAASFGGYCLQANQGSGYVSLPVIDLTMEKWTIDLWVTLDALPSTGYYSGIADYGTAADGNGGFAFVALYDGALRVHFDYYTGITAGYVSAGQRVHLFFMRNGARFYCGANGNVGENRLVADTPFVGNKGFRIGRANMTYTDPKSVKVDEWRIVVNESNYPTSGTYSPPNFPFPDP